MVEGAPSGRDSLHVEGSGDGFSKADATFAVNHITVNWNEQAVRSAKDYLSFSHFSRAA